MGLAKKESKMQCTISFNKEVNWPCMKNAVHFDVVPDGEAVLTSDASIGEEEAMLCLQSERDNN